MSSARTTLVIANNHEFFGHLDSVLPAQGRDELIAVDLAESILSLFWAQGPAIIVLPRTVDRRFLADVVSQLGIPIPTLIEVDAPVGSLCGALLDDDRLYDQLIQILGQAGTARVLAWGTTVELAELLSRLESDGATLDLSEIGTAGGQWIGRFVGSKQGFRQFASPVLERDGLAHLPEGYACEDLAQAAGIAGWFNSRGLPCIAKPNHGFGGWGLCVMSPDAALTPSAALEATAHSYGGLLAGGVIVVEQFIFDRPPTVAGPPMAPTVNVLVERAGQVSYQFSARMRSGEQYLYGGSEVGPDALPASIAERLERLAESVGTAMRDLGYCGWFDIDAVCGPGGELFLTEINARRTSPIFVAEIQRRVQHDHQLEPYVVSSDSVHIRELDWRDLRSVLEPWWFPLEHEARGVIVASPPTTFAGHTLVTIVTVGRDREDALRLEDQAFAAISSASPA